MKRFGLWMLILIGSAAPAWAGGPCEPETKEDLRALRQLKRFHAQPKAIQPVLKALCHEDYAMQLVAGTRLRELGPGVVRPLFERALAKRPCPGQLADEEGPHPAALAEVLCTLADREVDAPFCSGSRRVKRDPAQNQRARGWFTAQLTKPGPRRAMALDVLARVAANRPGDGCSGQQSLLELARPALLGLLASKDTADRKAAIAILARSASEQDRIVAALRETVVRASEDERRLILIALGDLGPPGRAALPDLDRWFGLHVANACEAGQAAGLGPLAKALAGVGGPRATAHLTSLLSLWQRGCPGFPASEMLGAIEQTRELDLMGANILRGQLVSPQLSLWERARIARTLKTTRASLSAELQSQADALLRKEDLLSGRAEPQILPPAAVREAADVQHSWRVCHQEIGREPSQPLPYDAAQRTAFSTLRNCLDRSLCGPNLADHRSTIDLCCQAAWPSERPLWCRAAE